MPIARALKESIDAKLVGEEGVLDVDEAWNAAVASVAERIIAERLDALDPEDILRLYAEAVGDERLKATLGAWAAAKAAELDRQRVLQLQNEVAALQSSLKSERAALVADVPEPVPANAVYNATTGSRVLPAEVFDPVSNDPRAAADIASRVDGRYTGTTPQILQWAACKWGVDEKLVRAQAQLESSWRQAMMGDWTSDPALCAPDHGPGVDGQPGRCPESWGILQVRYHYFGPAFPDVIASTAFNVDTAYGIWRACFEGYEWWLRDTATDPYHPYRAGDALGCAGRWYSGRWYDRLAERYIYCLRRVMDGRQPCQ